MMTVRFDFRQPVRDAALLRAKYCCERCGVHEDLQLHYRGHVADRSLFNVEVLCAQCHAREHRQRRLHRWGDMRFKFR